MNDMKIVTVIGARPQFVKAAMVSRILKETNGVSEIISHTGQHYDENMSGIFFDELSIPRPKYNLGICGGHHGQMTGRQLEAIEKVLLDERPDMVLVYGDTNSTLAAAIAAAKLNIPLSHVEAGLRSFNRSMPEEINRILTDHASDLLFAPTEAAVRNLRNEGLSERRTHLVGDVMYDAALFYGQFARPPGWFSSTGCEAGEFVLATIHRAENTDDLSRLSSILSGLSESGLPVVLPLHPRTRARMVAEGIMTSNRIYLAPPVGFLEMLWLEMHCAVIATDSGGVQKEAYFQNKPCVTLREETEWVELVSIGANVLVGACPMAIASALQPPFLSVAAHRPLYGNGNAGRLTVDVLLAF